MLVTKELFTPWTMKSSLAPLKHSIGHWLNSSQDHFGLHQEKDVRVTMSLEVSKCPFWRPALSTIMVQMGFAMGEAKEVLLLQMSVDHGKEMSFDFLCQTRSLFTLKTNKKFI